MTDAELVRAALAGSEGAFREIVTRYERPLYAFVRRMVQDPATAEDVAQEVFLKIFRALASYDGERKFSSWLFKIAHNTTIDWSRRRGPQLDSLEGDGDDERAPRQFVDESALTPEKRRETSELGTALDRALATLRPEYREVILLRFREGLAYEEIAEISGMPLGTVKTFLHRARKQMEERLTAAGWSPGAGRSRPRGGPGGPSGTPSGGPSGEPSGGPSGEPSGGPETSSEPGA